MPFYNIFKILQHPSPENPLVWQTKSPQLQHMVAGTAYTNVASPTKWSLLQAVVNPSGQLCVLYLESTDIIDIDAIESLSNEILQDLSFIQNKIPKALKLSHSIITFAWLDTVVHRRIPHQTALNSLKDYFANPANAAQHIQPYFMATNPTKQAEWLQKIDQITNEPAEQERVRLADQLKQEWIQQIPIVKSQVEANEQARQHNQEIFNRRNAEIGFCLKSLYQKYKTQLGENTRLALLTSSLIPQQVFAIGQGIQVQDQVVNVEQQAVVLPQNQLTLRIAVDNPESRPLLVLGRVENIQEFKFELLPFEEALAEFDALIKQNSILSNEATALRELLIKQKDTYKRKQLDFYQDRLNRFKKADASKNAKILQEVYPDTELKQLSEVLNKTNCFLKNPTRENYIAYQAFANSLPGHSVLWQQITGAMLILAGVALAIACGVVIAASHGAALPVAVPAVSQATTWIAAGSAVFLASLGLFAAYQGREKGLAKATHHLADIVCPPTDSAIVSNRQQLLKT